MLCLHFSLCCLSPWFVSLCFSLSLPPPPPPLPPPPSLSHMFVCGLLLYISLYGYCLSDWFLSHSFCLSSFSSSWMLILYFLVAVVNTLNTKIHSSKEMAEFSIKNADVTSIFEMKLCKPCTSFTSHLHSSCGMVWYRTLRVKQLKGRLHLISDY